MWEISSHGTPGLIDRNREIVHSEPRRKKEKNYDAWLANCENVAAYFRTLIKTLQDVRDENAVKETIYAPYRRSSQRP